MNLRRMRTSPVVVCGTGVLRVMALALLLSACTTVPRTPSPADPMEPLNRGIYSFNEVVDGVLLKPAATAYQAVTPQLVRTGVSNFFGNLGDVWSMVNNVLQFKPRQAADSFFRTAVNTTIGLAGFLDVASDMGIEQHKEDFGQTLGYWGFPCGPYMVLPILGASSLRDTVALPADFKGHLVNEVDPVRTRNALTAAQWVSKRADLMHAESVLDAVALDKYSFIRDAYLQKRRNDVYDGNPPSEVDRPDFSSPAQAAPAQ